MIFDEKRTERRKKNLAALDSLFFLRFYFVFAPL
jgi:hypothetical protein